MNKKIIIASFFVFLMLLVPFTAVSETINKDRIKNFTNFYEEAPKVYINEEENEDLNDYVDDTYSGEDKTEAKNIVDSIISNNPELEDTYLVDMVQLSDIIESSYYYRAIPDKDLNDVTTKAQLNDLIDEYWNFDEYIFEGLIVKIIELIKNRLGWMHQFFNQGHILFVDGVTLAKQTISNIQAIDIAVLVASFVNLIIKIPAWYFSESIKKLFNLDFEGFTETISNFTGAFTNELVVFISDIISILEFFEDTFRPFINYLERTQDFIDWLVNDQPWKDKITVSGVATLNGKPLANANITCRGEKTQTDSEGNFYLTVFPSNNSEDSVPSNSWYGMHNCVITVSKDGEVLKETPKILSYVFSGGIIEWTFFVIKSKARSLDKPSILQIISKILERIQLIHTNIQNKINSFYASPI